GGILPDALTLERLRPAVAGTAGPSPRPFRTLVVGVYLADRLTNVDDIVASFESDHHEVVQRWACLNAEPPTERVAAVTAERVQGRASKYQLLNRLLAGADLNDFDYVVVSDDDVVLARGFLDAYLPIQASLSLAIAQPARTRNSYIDHQIVAQE